MKQITLWIKTKRKIRSNIGQKEHNNRSPHDHSSSVNSPQILTPPPPPPCHNSTSLITAAHDTENELAILIIESEDIYKNHYVLYNVSASRRYHVCLIL